VSSHTERGCLRTWPARLAVANGARSSSNGQRVVESEVELTRERFAVGLPAPARRPGATLALWRRIAKRF
jgi:hypothetical protein